MKLGISVYTAPEYSLQDNIKYIKQAHRLGYELLFTSLHLPEVNYACLLSDFKKLTEVATDEGFFVIADIGPRTVEMLQLQRVGLSIFKSLNVDSIRFDYGFQLYELIRMSRNGLGLKIQVNASTLQPEDFELLKRDDSVCWGNIIAGHNFYPKVHTGLSTQHFLKNSRILKCFGLPVFAFIPSQIGRRGPMFDGLPTLEVHRNLSANFCARHLAATGVVDGVIFGDAYAGIEELQKVAEVDGEVIEIKLELEKEITKQETEIVFLSHHVSRLDPSEYMIRSLSSRQYATLGTEVPARNNEKLRKAYSVTIDNLHFKRYSGELQIVLTDLPPDPRVNIVGSIPLQERELVKEITAGKKFRFIL